MQFNLQTSHGRAQAYAHSAEGAAQVRFIEECEANVRVEVAEMLDIPLHSVWSGSQYILEELQDTDYDKLVKKFEERLLLKDVRAFRRLISIRLKKEEDVLNELIAIQTTLGEIKETFGMP